MFIVLAVFDLLYITVSIIFFTSPCQGPDALVHELEHVITLTQACCTSSCSRALSCILYVESPVCACQCVCVCVSVCVCVQACSMKISCDVLRCGRRRLSNTNHADTVHADDALLVDYTFVVCINVVSS
jgi:hypothetical protein